MNVISDEVANGLDGNKGGGVRIVTTRDGKTRGWMQIPLCRTRRKDYASCKGVLVRIVADKIEWGANLA